MTSIDVVPPPFWQWIRLSEYRRPPLPIQHRVWRFWLRRAAPAEAGRSSAAPHATRQAAVHHPIEEDVAESLQRHLAAWFADPNATPRLVVLPPHLGVESVMRRVAASIRWPVLDPPSPTEILDGGEEWRGRLTDLGDTPFVIATLHRVFLRHTDGMDRLRELLALLAQRGGRVLVGCESWGWCYVRKVLHPTMFGEPLTLQAFDADRLARWLRDEGGGLAIPLRQLAGESAGNVAVARALTERIAPSGMSADDADVTVPLWWRSRLPAWPPESVPMDTFIAHSVLIHGGLPVDALAATILATADEITGSLERLAAAGLIEETRGTWRATAVGYPAVSAHLFDHGYTDDF